MTKPFTPFARILHWTMAVLILTMLFIGIGMVTTPDGYSTLVAIHRPLGIAILALAAIRLIYRLLVPPPPLPVAAPGWLRAAAAVSHALLYLFMFAQPLLGWGMLSAGAYPVEMYGAIHLPPILPHDAALYAALRHAHTIVALLFFLTILLHLAAALVHALIFRDGVFQSMAGGAQPGARTPDEPHAAPAGSIP